MDFPPQSPDDAEPGEATATATDPATRLHAVEAELLELRAEHERLREEHECLREETAEQVGAIKERLKKALTTYREDLKDLNSRHEQLNRRFTQVLAQRHSDDRSSGPSTAELSHQELSERYQSLLDQEVKTFIANAVAPHKRAQHAELRATYTRALCDALLGPSPATPQDVWRVHPLSTTAPGPDTTVAKYIEQLVEAAARLRFDVAAAGGEHRWDFEFAPAMALDPRRQRPWRDSPEQLPVRAVITPAYVVGGRVWARQQVLTA